MLPKFRDLSGRRFGKWRVLRFHDRRSGHYRWLCRCRCGAEHVVWQHSLLEGRSKGCKACREPHRKHGFFGTPTYTSYLHMLNRCTNRRSKDWPKYGGRGIKVCKRWQGPNGFANFLADMGVRPRDYRGRLKTLDRIDNDGDYEPGNVRWATALQQRRNQARSRELNVLKMLNRWEEVKRRRLAR